MDKTKEMTQEREAAILEGSINKWGNTMQITVAIEELSELQKALCKCLRYLGSDHHENGKYPPDVLSSIREEIADVSIMLNQLELIFGDCPEEEIAKLERLEGMVGIVPQPDASTCRWTPDEIEIARAIRRLYPDLRYIARMGRSEVLMACHAVVFDDRCSHAEIPGKSFADLLPGDAVLIDDILAEGGVE